MGTDDFITLVYKSLKGELSTTEKKQLKEGLAKGGEQQELYDDIRISWNLSEQSLDLNHIDVEADLIATKKLLSKEGATPEAKVVPLRTYLLRIAATILLLAGGVYWYITSTSNLPTEEILFAASANLPFELPDGSTGILKKGSQLTFSSDFATNRVTQLEGVAQFEVIHNPEFPFKVKANEAIVEVLGTNFTVNHQNGQISVGVHSGKVSLTQNEQGIVLEKGEVGSCQNYIAAPQKQNIVNTNFNYWKNKQLRFESESLQSVIEQLSLIYNVNINISNAEMESCQLFGTFTSDSIQTVLQTIANRFEMALQVTEENAFILNEGTCQ
ncbi:MAG: FecR family protein [Bacteroidota bacterium]